MEEAGNITTNKKDFDVLPEDCISKIISFTTPTDACIVSLVSKLFKSAADSDNVWETFIPKEYRSIVKSPSIVYLSKKELYLAISDRPILIQDGKRIFSLEKKTGQICLMLGSRDLSITWGSTPEYWEWMSIPESRFPENAKLNLVWWLEIRGLISPKFLSKNTLYAAYFVYKLEPSSYGFEDLPIQARFEPVGSQNIERTVCLVLKRPTHRLRRQNHNSPLAMIIANLRYVNQREDGWSEVELGEFFNVDDMEEELEMSFMETEILGSKGGLNVQGIEVRPKACL